MRLERSRHEAVAALGRVMTVWAHPDDETYLAGGLMATAAGNDQPVSCVIATPGDYAAAASARASIGSLRQLELGRAMGVLGVTDVSVLGMRDGECAAFDATTAKARLASIIAERRPDTIVTFGPDGFTGHPDHRAVHRWVMAAVAVSRPPVTVLFAAATPEMAADGRDIDARFGVFEPGLPVVCPPEEVALDVELEGDVLDVKLRALRAHDSQTRGLIESLGEDRYRRWISREVFTTGTPATMPLVVSGRAAPAGDRARRRGPVRP
jgi:LmbE family N-acetylglucosaminyl deacetylase